MILIETPLMARFPFQSPIPSTNARMSNAQSDVVLMSFEGFSRPIPTRDRSLIHKLGRTLRSVSQPIYKSQV